jgi:hypothetical protein
LIGLGRSRTYDGNDVLADGHTDCTNEKQATATEALNTIYSGYSHADIDNGSGNGDEEGVLDTSVREESSAKVEDEVDAGELLPCLEEDTSKSAESDTIVRGTEAIKVGALAKLLLVPQVNANLFKFGDDLRVVSGERSEAGKSGSGIRVTTLLDQPTRGLEYVRRVQFVNEWGQSAHLWKEGHTTSENRSPDKLNSNGNAI